MFKHIVIIRRVVVVKQETVKMFTVFVLSIVYSKNNILTLNYAGRDLILKHKTFEIPYAAYPRTYSFFLNG